jgi:hypothetical protein
VTDVTSGHVTSDSTNTLWKDMENTKKGKLNSEMI